MSGLDGGVTPLVAGVWDGGALLVPSTRSLSGAHGSAERGGLPHQGGNASELPFQLL